eukprot:m.46723 g.46723  ORF g.46723 m.46723 type:complete len:376 (-) comp5936_c0_seq3:108-1235(-)
MQGDMSLEVPLDTVLPAMHQLPPGYTTQLQPMQAPTPSSHKQQRHTRQEDWVTCLDCVNKPKPALPDRWRPPKDDCIKCVKARSRAMSADKAQIDNYVNHAYSRTGQLLVLMAFEPTKKELKIQGAPIVVERFLNHDVQGFLRRSVFEPAISESDEARHMRQISFRKALPLLPRKGLMRMTQDELRSFIGPLVCAYADREQPGWSDESKKIDCWPEGIPWGNPKHGSWKMGAEVPNAIFRRIIASIYQASGREDMLRPCPPICRGACEKCCAGVAPYDDDMGMDNPDEVDVPMGPHQLSEEDQALAAVAVAAAAAAPLPTMQGVVMHHPVALPTGPSHDDDPHSVKRRRLDNEDFSVSMPPPVTHPAAAYVMHMM